MMEAAAHHRREHVEALPTHRTRRLRDTVALPISARPATQPSPDADSREWLATLRSGDARIHAEAVGRLHELLLRAARFEVRRRSGAARHVGREQLDDVAHQSAHDALVAVLAKLDDYRGESRFTTWAYKFALLEAGVKMRRRAWNDREVTLEPAGWPAFADPGASPHHDA
jgi:RNA polymerase sigma-70 factor, ECF subfamily